tara:strand:- start:647 stop:1264 length:618 start_codon:yes stop_codon:yes gene_type:complete
MFEIIEDNKHLILLIFVAILFLSSIFANKSSKKFNKKKLINDSLNLLRKEAPNMNRRKKVFSNIPFYPNYNYPLPQMAPNKIQPKQQSFSPPQENTYKNEISKESIEDTIKDIKNKKEAKITNNIISKGNQDMDHLLKNNNMLESDKNFDRIMDLVKFKMNPMQNNKPNMSRDIDFLRTGCNKDTNFDLAGFDGSWKSEVSGKNF